MAKTTTINERTENPAQQATAQISTCQHHWLIETPRGTLSRGRCKRCGEEREFRNSATDHLWEDESGSGYNSWRGVRAARKSNHGEEASVSAASDAGAMAV